MIVSIYILFVASITILLPGNGNLNTRFGASYNR